MDSASILARNLELIRIAKGYTQENLAIDAEISRSHFANIKSGTHSATLEMVDRLAHVLGIEAWQILLPDLIVESVQEKTGVKNEFVAPSTLRIVRDQGSKRKLRSDLH